ncbi:MAG: hypothetical protein CR984_02000 [Proteobacteria bacterium]|nr:MAG: hypothetical protein CR984_02000 [Pseudomonadota bacterium]
MAGNKKKYRRLSGNRFGLFCTNALWQADDHLLRVEAGMMTERYWRFYFNDIQAIVLHRTRAHCFWNAFWGILTLAAGASLMIESVATAVSLGFTILFSLLLAASLYLGPGCRVFLQTAVQVQRLPALDRMRKANKVMNRVREAVERCQGTLDLAAARPAANEAATAPMAGQLAYHQPPGSRAALAATGPRNAGFAPWLHKCLFATLLVSALCHGWHLIQPHAATVVATHVLLLALVIWGIVALVRNYDAMRGTFLMKMTWTTLTATCIQALAAYILYIVASIHNPELAYNNRAMLMAYVDLHLRDLPYRVGISAVFASMNLLLGGIGFVILSPHKRPGPE